MGTDISVAYPSNFCMENDEVRTYTDMWNRETEKTVHVQLSWYPVSHITPLSFEEDDEVPYLQQG